MARRDDRRKDPWGFFPVGDDGLQRCFECGALTTGRHHVVPKSKGGTKQLPLCPEHHNLVHGSKVIQANLISEGLQRARERGVRLGAKPKLTPEKLARIQGLRAEGLSIKKISAAIGLSVGTVWKALSGTING